MLKGHLTRKLSLLVLFYSAARFGFTIIHSYRAQITQHPIDGLLGGLVRLFIPVLSLSVGTNQIVFEGFWVIWRRPRSGFEANYGGPRSRSEWFQLRGVVELGRAEMSGVEEQLEIKFRLHDGSDIGPKKYTDATSVATMKESVLAQWPKDQGNGPKTVNDIKLINAGKILEDNKTLGECRSQICDFTGVTTMHVVICPTSSEKGIEKKSKLNDGRCGCTIL